MYIYFYISSAFSAGFSFIITSLFFLSQRPFHSLGMSTSWFFLCAQWKKTDSEQAEIEQHVKLFKSKPARL